MRNYTVSLTQRLGTSYTEQIAEGMVAQIQDTCEVTVSFMPDLIDRGADMQRKHKDKRSAEK